MEPFERLAQKCLRAKIERKKYASHSNPFDPDRSGRPSLAGESFHPHGGQHQVNLERRRSHWRGVVAPERIWTVSFTLANTRWVTKKQAKFAT